ncbi:hypothetical protein L6452_25652 [Arctium lappa]|uniref:Uncharacterized protein n=1 Tax=Arctium lappa TaxID=4217 RepID=A0ACB9ABQ2_ARCLA|nr:hypothetical protein L6452_25652 [Arctium lappa]
MANNLVEFDGGNGVRGIGDGDLCVSGDVLLEESQNLVGADEDLDASFSSLASNNDEVVLAFDSMKCDSSRVVAGVLDSLDCFCVEECFVPNEEGREDTAESQDRHSQILHKYFYSCFDCHKHSTVVIHDE